MTDGSFSNKHDYNTPLLGTGARGKLLETRNWVLILQLAY